MDLLNTSPFTKLGKTDKKRLKELLKKTSIKNIDSTKLSTLYDLARWNNIPIKN